MASKSRAVHPQAPSFEWVPAKGSKRTYELRCGNQVAGWIRWPKMFGSLAEAQFGERQWTFKRGGFLRPHVTVRLAATGEDAGVLEHSWTGGGMLHMANGRSFPWDRKGLWSHRFAFCDASGSELVVVEPKVGLLRRTGKVQVSQKAEQLPELPVLLLLGWYVTMLMADEDAAVVVTCCS